MKGYLRFTWPFLVGAWIAYSVLVLLGIGPVRLALAVVVTFLIEVPLMVRRARSRDWAA